MHLAWHDSPHAFGLLCAGGDAAVACSSSTSLHKGPIKALAALPEAQGQLVLTAGQDQRLLLAEVPALAASNGAAAPPASVLATYRSALQALLL